MTVISYEELCEMAGIQKSKKDALIRWLQDECIPHVIGQDGKARTTQQLLDRYHEGKKKVPD